MKIISAVINGLPGKLLLKDRLNTSCIGCILSSKEFCMLDTPGFLNIQGKDIKCADCRNVFGSHIVIGIGYDSSINSLSDISYRMINNEFCKDRCIYENIRNKSNDDIISYSTYWGSRDKCPMRFLLDRITGDIGE